MKTIELEKKSKFKKFKKSLFIGCTILTASIFTSCDGTYPEENHKNKIEIQEEEETERKTEETENGKSEENHQESSLCPKDLEDRFDSDNVSGKFDKKSKAIIDDEIEIVNPPFFNETTLNGEYARLLNYCVDGECSEVGITIQENKQYSYEINGEIITFEGCYVRENEDMIFAIDKEKTITTFYIPCSLELDGEEKEYYELWNNSQEVIINYGKITGNKCEDNNQEIILKYNTSFEKPIEWKNEYVDGVNRQNVFVEGEKYFVSQANDILELYKEIIYNKNMKLNEIIEINENEIQLIDLGEKVTLLINGEEKTISEKGIINFEFNEEKYKLRVYSINENESVEIGISRDEDNISIRGMGNVGYINIITKGDWKITERYNGTTNEEGVLGYTIEYSYSYEGKYVEDKK